MSETSNIRFLKKAGGSSKEERLPKDPVYLPAIQLFFSVFGRIIPSAATELAYRLFTRPRWKAKHLKADAIIRQAETFHFRYENLMLKGYSWGLGDRSVLLVHGWESRGTALRSFVPSLVAAGFKVYAFDAPAHGDSEGKWTNLLHYGGAIETIISKIGGVHGVIAHSFGAAGTVYAVQKSAVTLDKMVILAAPANMEAIFADLVKILNLPSPTKQRLRSKLEGIIGKDISQIDIAQTDVTGKINDVLIIHDKHDKVVPFSFAEEIAKKWNNSSLLITEGFGHYRLVKDPDVIEAVNSFIHKKELYPQVAS